MTEIFHLLKAGGSGNGITSWLQNLDCTRRTKLDAECRVNGERTSSDSWATGVGTLVHAYREIWYNDLGTRFDVNDVTFVLEDGRQGCFPWGQSIPHKMLVEAQTLFNAYRLLQPRPLGDVLATEKFFPRDEDDRIKMVNAIGLDPITCKIDAFLTITPQHSKMIFEKYGEHVAPGLWINDLKTAARHYDTQWEQLQASIQQRTYIMIAQSVGLHVHGSLLEVVSKSKPTSIKLVVVQSPTQHEIRVLRETVKSIRVRTENELLSDECNINRCWWPSRCLHDETGACSKI